MTEMAQDKNASLYDANNYVNDPSIEYKWAVKAYQHAEVYFNQLLKILCSVDSKYLKLTQIDDTVYTEYQELFKDFQVEKIDVDELKSTKSKEIWRPFCESFKDRVEDYNMATLLRIDCNGDYSEENTTLVPRIQFYAIEIARNRQGKNGKLKEKFNTKSKLEK